MKELISQGLLLLAEIGVIVVMLIIIVRERKKVKEREKKNRRSLKKTARSLNQKSSTWIDHRSNRTKSIIVINRPRGSIIKVLLFFIIFRPCMGRIYPL